VDGGSDVPGSLAAMRYRRHVTVASRLIGEEDDAVAVGERVAAPEARRPRSRPAIRGWPTCSG